jgi:hypothetical protein
VNLNGSTFAWNACGDMDWAVCNDAGVAADSCALPDMRQIRSGEMSGVEKKGAVISLTEPSTKLPVWPNCVALVQQKHGKALYH